MMDLSNRTIFFVIIAVVILIAIVWWSSAHDGTSTPELDNQEFSEPLGDE